MALVLGIQLDIDWFMLVLVEFWCQGILVKAQAISIAVITAAAAAVIVTAHLFDGYRNNRHRGRK